ncbi:MAG: translocation/assembly module TamB domain-containing protein [Pseudomonadota bacterium]
MSIYRRLAYALLISATLVFLVIPVTLFSLINTEAGSHWVIKFGQSLLPDTVTYQTFSGTLADSFTFTGVSFQSDRFSTELESLSVAWSPSDLLTGKLTINELHLGTGEVRLRAPDAEQETSAEPTSIEDFSVELPVEVQLKRFRLDNSWLFINDAPAQQVAITSSLQLLKNGQLKLSQLLLEHQYATVSVAGSLALSFPLKHQLTTNIELHSPDYPATSVEAQLSGNIDNTEGSFTTDKKLNISGDFAISAPLEQLSWTSAIKFSDTDPTPWLSAFNINGVDDLSLDGNLSLAGDETGLVIARPTLELITKAQTAALDGTVNLQQQIVNIDTLTAQLSGDVNGPLSLAGTIGLAQPTDLDFSLTTDALTYQTTTGSGRLKMQGSLQNLNLQTDITARLKDGNQVSFTSQGRLTRTELNLNNIRLQESAFNGSVAGSASVNWADELLFNSDIDGQLFGKPTSLIADVRYDAPYLQINSLDLKWRDSSLQASGMMAPGRQLSVTATIPSLADLPFLPADLSGAVAVKANIEGDLTSPWADVELTSDEFTVGGQSLTDVVLTAEGGKNSQSMQLQTTTNDTEIALALDNTLDSNAVTTKLKTLSIKPSDLAEFSLDKAATLIYQWQQPSLSVSDFCLTQESFGQPICIRVNDKDSTSAISLVELDAPKIPLQLVNYMFPASDIKLDGWAAAQLSTQFDLNNFEASQMKGRLSVENAELAGLEESVLIDKIAINIVPENTATKVSINADASDIGLQLDGSVTAAKLSADSELSGQLVGVLEDIRILQIISPALSQAEGNMRLDIAINGSLANPKLRPKMSATIEQLLINQTGTLITATELRLQPSNESGQSFEVTGDGTVGTGKFSLSGSLDVPTQALSAELTGSDLQIMDTPKLSIIASPQLTLSIEDRHIDVGGTINVPKALITPPQMSNVVSPSSDVVVKQQQTDSEPAYTSNADVTVTLGDDVRVAAYGFEGRLTGGVNIVQSSGSVARANGQIGVQAGTYEIYGQELTIEKGQFIYNGGPIENPGLNLQVVRKPPEATNAPKKVGAQVTGTLVEPELNLFSDPAMPEASVLSYLMFGRAPNSGAESSNLELQAALLLTGDITESVTQNIKDTFGFDEVALDSSSNDVNDTSLYIGKYLTPRLYIKYGIGLIESTSSFFLRYQLTDHLSLESNSSSESQGGDLIYSIEK